MLRADTGTTGPGPSRVLQGARTVAESALTFTRFARSARPVLVNGTAGALVTSRTDDPVSVVGCTVTRGKIVAIDILADPARLRALQLPVLDE